MDGLPRDITKDWGFVITGPGGSLDTLPDVPGAGGGGMVG